MIKGDFEQSCRRGVSRDVTSDAFVFFVGANNHRHRIPSNDAFDSAFNFAVTRIRRLLVHVDRVDVRGVGFVRQINALSLGSSFQYR